MLEGLALENLERQGYECYLPTLPSEKLRQGVVTVSQEPLFPRYLFVRLGEGGQGPGWGPIRSTRGVNRLVTFGTEPARVDDGLVDMLRARQAGIARQPQRLFEPGERVQLTETPFAGIEGIYQLADGERRVMVLIELLSKPVLVRASPAGLRKVG